MITLAICILALVAIASTVGYFSQRSDLEKKEFLIKQLESDSRMKDTSIQSLTNINNSNKSLIQEQNETISKLAIENKELKSKVEGLRAVRDEEPKQVSDNVHEMKSNHQQKDTALPSKPNTTKKRLGNKK